MRMNLLMLGMLIPVAAAVAWYGLPGPTGGGANAVERIYATDGARVVTGDVEELIGDGEGEAALASSAESADATPHEDGAASWLGAIADLLPSRAPRKPLLVVLVAGRERVAIARKGMADDRIAGESEDAFVAGNDLLVAGSREAAASMIMLLDWVDRPIELVAVEQRKPAVVLGRGRRNADAEALPTLDGVAAEVAAVRGSDQARLRQAVDLVRSAGSE